MPVAVTDTSGVALTNYQVRLDINTATLVTAGHMEATGADIRFGDSCSTAIYPHFVESGINTANTIIWVTVPSVPANGTSTMYMYYGNPSATGTGSFSAVFPAAFISSGPNVTLTGVQNYDWFQLNANDTVFTTAGACSPSTRVILFSMEQFTVRAAATRRRRSIRLVQDRAVEEHPLTVVPAAAVMAA